MSPQIVCKHIPPAQATDFLSAALDGMLLARSACAQAAGEWLLTFLETCGGQLFTEVRDAFSRGLGPSRLCCCRAPRAGAGGQSAAPGAQRRGLCRIRVPAASSRGCSSSGDTDPGWAKPRWLPRRRQLELRHPKCPVAPRFSGTMLSPPGPGPKGDGRHLSASRRRGVVASRWRPRSCSGRTMTLVLGVSSS